MSPSSGDGGAPLSLEFAQKIGVDSYRVPEPYNPASALIGAGIVVIGVPIFFIMRKVTSAGTKASN